MPILTVIFTLLLFTIAFLPTSIAAPINPFFAFVYHIISLLITHVTLSLLLVIALSFFLITTYRMEKKFPLHKKFLFSFYHMAVVSIIGFFFAFVVLFIIAFIQLNMQALLMNLNPYGFGIVTDSNMIVESLQDNNLPPKIILSEDDQKRIAQEVCYAWSGNDSFYGRYILKSIPGVFMLSVNKFPSSMALIDNSLIITEINPPDLERVSPMIGYLYVKKYFPTRVIRSFPSMYLLSPKQYVAFRQKDASTKLVSITKDISTLKTSVSSLSASIQVMQDDVAKLEKAIDDGEYQREVAFNKCLREKVKAVGGSEDDYKTSCEAVKKPYNDALPNRKDIDKKKSLLEQNKTQLTTNVYYYNFFTMQQQLLLKSKTNLPFELGAFEPPKEIGILLNTTEPTRIADYFATVTHEYLHYASYTPGKRFLSGFFEEGLTEYFARMTIQDTLNTKTGLGYPVYVQIISQIMKIIPESELAQIYFTKDEQGLEHALDRVYGDDFYKNNIVLFDSLQYSGNLKTTLTLANKIMKKIGGPQLTEKDIVSKRSILGK